MQNLLNGRVAIITGASRGTGAAIAKRFAAAVARVTKHSATKQQHVDKRNLDGSIMTKKPDDGQGGL